ELAKKCICLYDCNEYDGSGKGNILIGTEVITGEDGSIAALLGASPGASTAVHVMLDVIERCFPQQLSEWESKIKEMIPSYGTLLMDDSELFEKVKTSSSEALGLHEKEPVYN